MSCLLRTLQIPQCSQLQGEVECWVGAWDPSWENSSTAKQQGLWERVQACSLAVPLNPGFTEGTVPRLSLLPVYWSCAVAAKMLLQQTLSFSFPLQIDHTEVDTIENRQNGRPATSLPAPKSAVSPCPHLLSASLLAGTVNPAMSLSLLILHLCTLAHQQRLSLTKLVLVPVQRGFIALKAMKVLWGLSPPLPNSLRSQIQFSELLLGLLDHFSCFLPP